MAAQTVEECCLQLNARKILEFLKCFHLAMGKYNGSFRYFNGFNILVTCFVLTLFYVVLFFKYDPGKPCVIRVNSVIVQSGHGLELQLSLFNGNLTSKELKKVSQKEECDDFERLKLYPSNFGFESCKTYIIGDASNYDKVVLCNSSGQTSSAFFMNNVMFGLLECSKQHSEFVCVPRTNTSLVCDCNGKCDENSVANNLPITSPVQSRKVMSFSVYGGEDYYCGALRQIRLAKIFFPNWKSRIYVNSSVPSKIVEMIEKEAEVKVIPPDSPFITSGTFWRFLVADDDDVDIYCIRDSDSIFSYREALTVNEWLKSGKGFHTLRDHPYHTVHILGGLWCGRKRIKNMMELMLSHTIQNKKDDDQDFLTEKLWPVVKDDILIHDSFPSSHPGAGHTLPLPIERMGCEYIGVALRSEYDILVPNRMVLNDA